MIVKWFSGSGDESIVNQRWIKMKKILLSMISPAKGDNASIKLPWNTEEAVVDSAWLEPPASCRQGGVYYAILWGLRFPLFSVCWPKIIKFKKFDCYWISLRISGINYYGGWWMSRSRSINWSRNYWLNRHGILFSRPSNTIGSMIFSSHSGYDLYPVLKAIYFLILLASIVHS